MTTTVDQYIARRPKNVQATLERVRAIIRKAVPGADEVISYQIPAYKLRGEIVIFFAGWKQHFSLYPATDGLAEAFAKELAAYEVSKGTIRFPFDQGVPERLIARIAKFRAKEAAARLETKQAAKAAKKTAKVGKQAAKPRKKVAKKSRVKRRAQTRTNG